MAQPMMEPASKIAPELSTKLRALAHDLSNSIETIMQASYLLGQANLDDTTKKWVSLIDNATRDAARDRKSTRLNSSHRCISYAVFCLKKKKEYINFPVAFDALAAVVVYFVQPVYVQSA